MSITDDYTTLMRQASYTAEDYFIKMVKAIDRRFGEGYAKNNPQLIGRLVSVCNGDMSTATFCVAIQEFTEQISILNEIIGEISKSIREIKDIYDAKNC